MTLKGIMLSKRKQSQRFHIGICYLTDILKYQYYGEVVGCQVLWGGGSKNKRISCNDQVVLHPGCGCVTQISSVKICRTVHQQKTVNFIK